jgi:restriction system protein
MPPVFGIFWLGFKRLWWSDFLVDTSWSLWSRPASFRLLGPPVTIPTYEDLMLPLLREYATTGSPLSIKNLMPILAQRLGLSDEDLAERLPSGRQGLFHNRLHWAKTYMARAGLLDSPARGLAQITERGRAVLRDNPERIDGNTLAQFAEFTEWKLASVGGDSAEVATSLPLEANPEASQRTPEERIEAARKDMEKGLRADLLERVRSLTPADFEELIIQLLLKMGYGSGAEQMAQALGGSGDQGIDGVIHQDPLGLDRVYIQAKRYADGNTVGSGAIRDFNGALDLKRAPKGLFVTASTFSRDARIQAESATRQIVLIDGEELAALMIRHGVGTRVVATVDIQEVDEGFFGV